MIDSQFIAFLLVAAALTVTPGADTMLVIRNTLRGGRSSGWATVLGVLAGVLLHAVLSGIGISVLLTTSTTAFTIVKLLGAGYLIWLGLQSIWGSRNRVDSQGGANTQVGGGAPLREGFLQGFITNVLNPKVAVFYVAFLPQFISAGDPVLAKSLMLACIQNLMGAIWLGGLAAVVERGRLWVERPRVRQWVSRVSGTVLAGLGLRLAFED